MRRTLKRTILGLLFLAMVAALAGCRTGGGVNTIAGKQPSIDTEPQIKLGETMLEKYSRLHKMLQTQKFSADKLAKELAEESKSLAQAVDRLSKLDLEIVELRRRAGERDAALKKYDQSQRALLKMNDEMRTVRQNLLQEKLARVRAEQSLVAARIETVRGRQRRADARRRAQFSEERATKKVTQEAEKAKNIKEGEENVTSEVGKTGDTGKTGEAGKIDDTGKTGEADKAAEEVAGTGTSGKDK